MDNNPDQKLAAWIEKRLRTSARPHDEIIREDLIKLLYSLKRRKNKPKN